MKPLRSDFTPRPWYREPWPWVVIAIPGIAVIASLLTLWLALSHPDQLAVEAPELEAITAELRAADGLPSGSTGEPDTEVATSAADERDAQR